jgi:hypothetical protein
MAGGLALLCLFMSYVQYALAGREGFLAAYSTPAQVGEGGLVGAGDVRAAC